MAKPPTAATAAAISSGTPTRWPYWMRLTANCLSLEGIMHRLVAAADLVAFQVDEHVREAGRHADEQQGRAAQHRQPRRLQPGRPAQHQQGEDDGEEARPVRPGEEAFPHLEPRTGRTARTTTPKRRKTQRTTPSLMRTRPRRPPR